MFGNVADLIQEGVTSDSLLDQSAQVGGSVTRHTVVIVEDAETHEDAAEAVTQPLGLVVLVGADLVENEGERVRGGEEESHSLRTSSKPSLAVIAEEGRCCRSLTVWASKETGGAPGTVASCTLSNSTCTPGLSMNTCARAAKQSQLETGSPEKRPPHRSWPADTSVAGSPGAVGNRLATIPAWPAGCLW